MIFEMQAARSKNMIRTYDEALAFFVECTLTTVMDMSSRKNPSKSQLKRQCDIAGIGLTWIGHLFDPGKSYGFPKVQDVLASGLSVSDWSKRLRDLPVEDKPARYGFNGPRSTGELTKAKGAMMAGDAQSAFDALAFLTECTLATVEDLAGRARPPKGELARQVSMAEFGMKYMRMLLEPGESCGCSRVARLNDKGISVEDFAARMMAPQAEPVGNGKVDAEPG